MTTVLSSNYTDLTYIVILKKMVKATNNQVPNSTLGSLAPNQKYQRVHMWYFIYGHRQSKIVLSIGKVKEQKGWVEITKWLKRKSWLKTENKQTKNIT